MVKVYFLFMLHVSSMSQQRGSDHCNFPGSGLMDASSPRGFPWSLRQEIRRLGSEAPAVSYFGPEGTCVSSTQVSTVGTGSTAILNLPWFSEMYNTYICAWAGSSAVKNPPAVQDLQKVQVLSLGWEDPLEEDVATYFSILAEESHG